MLPLSAEDIDRTRLPLRRATQLPGAAFLDPAVLEWELEHVFARGWVCAGHADQVREPGRFFTVEVAGESVVVVAGEDGTVRAFANTCRHRGARVVEDPEGTATRLRCPYHAWTYGLDGTLKNAPFTEKTDAFCAADSGRRRPQLTLRNRPAGARARR